MLRIVIFFNRTNRFNLFSVDKFVIVLFTFELDQTIDEVYEEDKTRENTVFIHKVQKVKINMFHIPVIQTCTI
jgi:hypothetical protein